MLYWHPTHCTLQLNFVQGDAQRDDQPCILATGDAYSGTSVIRYVRRPLPTATKGDEVSLVTAENKDGLHFHALTAVTRTLPKALPLVLHSIKVQLGNSSGVLKVLKVVEDDADDDGGGAENNKQQRSGAQKEKNTHRKKVKGKAGDANCSETQNSHTVGSKQHYDGGDPGSKHVFFEGGADMSVDSSVTLTVAFTGRIQAWDQGGIYTNDTPGTSSTLAPATQGVLLTHFEVALARLAFPCPDDPRRYRLNWQLQSLQLPRGYTTIVGNTVKVAEKAMGSKGTQYSFSSFGPVPAYVLAFAAFSGSVNVVEEELCLRDFSAASASGNDDCCRHNEAGRVVPLRVMAATSSGVTSDVLGQIAGFAQEAAHLLEDFFAAPLPLQQLPFSDEFRWQEEALTFVVAPTMPYISGMEHHGCIFLNESIYRSSSSSFSDASLKGPVKRHGTAGKRTDDVSRAELIVHEIAHHWVGNALGMPFVLKEGVALLLEQCLTDVIMGKPLRKIRPSGDAIVSPSVSQLHETAPATTTTTTTEEAAAAAEFVVVDTEKGKEFTGHSYQKALNTLRDLVSGMGFAVFKERMQRMYRMEVTERNRESCVADGDHCVNPLLPPYITATQFLAYMET